MKIYRAQRDIAVHVQPGTEFPLNTAFIDATGHPTLFSVKFTDYEANVSDPLGRFMIDKKLAFKSLLAAKEAEPMVLAA